MRATVPTSRVDNAYEPFPEGYYAGRIAGAELRDPNNDGSWLTLRLSLADVEPLGDTEDPGRSRFSGDITIRTDGITVTEVANFGDESLPWPIQLAGGFLAGIGEASGLAARDGTAVDFDAEEILDALQAGNLEGETVVFQVGHYEKENDEGEVVAVRDQFRQIGAPE